MILLDPHARPVIGHRGNRAHAPENTLESLREAVALGVDAVEFDLHVTRDGMLVLLHDPTLDRTTDQRGALAARSYAELRDVDAGARFTKDGGRSYPWRGRGVRIPTFDDAVEALPRDLPCIVELKTPDATPYLATALKRHAMEHRVIVAGFDARSTQPFQGRGLALGASTPEVVRLLLPALLRRRVTPTAFSALCIPPSHNGIPVPISAMARAVRASGVVTHVWTINDATHARRLWDAGIQGIISDDPAAILQERERR